jgi:hypothetical protein
MAQLIVALGVAPLVSDPRKRARGRALAVFLFCDFLAMFAIAFVEPAGEIIAWLVAPAVIEHVDCACLGT